MLIQTSFIGDVILATSALESLHQNQPKAKIDVLVRKGNESLFEDHPFINRVLVWNKTQSKNARLIQLAFEVRKNQYDLVVNLHRYASSGFITALSGASHKAGFRKNPLHVFFTHVCKHQINGRHEIQRNYDLIAPFCQTTHPEKPRLYPTEQQIKRIESFTTEPFCVIAPSSVWFTKQWPAEKWMELIKHIPESEKIVLIGAPNDHEYCEKIMTESKHPKIINLAGKLSLLESAALMSKAEMNYVNDSAPLHLASAMNAPVTSIFCSTTPFFGFGPLSDVQVIAETKEILDCRPCGIHGYDTCPKGHFKCALNIKPEQVFINK
ncbi:MAG: glycosyltransferase family 9 protein [Salibacteraceae bacterium]